MKFKKRSRTDDNTILEQAMPQKRRFETTQVNIWSELNAPIYGNKKRISPSRLANYLLDDPLIDWLELYYKGDSDKIKENKENYLQLYYDGGNHFEDLVMLELKKKFTDKFILINTAKQFGVTNENYKKTIQAMEAGFEIIAQAVLLNDKNNTCGIADLLVRSDFLNKLTVNPTMSKEEEKIKAPFLKGDYHYVVIDIKWTTLRLSARSNCINKEGRMPAYKGQLAIYNCALGNIQGYFPNKAYILAKGWKRERSETKIEINKETGIKKKITTKIPEYEPSCFNSLGVIDYNGQDNDSILKTIEALHWFRQVSTEGCLWDPYNPPNENMYPNMHSDNLVWAKVQGAIAEAIGEVTKVFNVGVKQRKELHKRGIYSYRDERCNSFNMGLNYTPDGGLTETATTINAILDINRDKQFDIFPRKIDNKLKNWHKQSPVDFYFDFETLDDLFVDNQMDIYDSSHIAGLIFEIGVGWVDANNSWNFEKFYIDNVSELEEMKMLDRFFDFITKKSLELDPTKTFIPRLFHWTGAEQRNLHSANIRNNKRWSNFINEKEKQIVYVDMHKVFTDPINKITIKGAFNFKLKSIGNALFNLGKINCKWPDTDISNGQIAMMEAIKYYRKKNNNTLTDNDKQIFEDIIKYNEVDCKMIYEIVNYLRHNH